MKDAIEITPELVVMVGPLVPTISQEEIRRLFFSIAPGIGKGNVIAMLHAAFLGREAVLEERQFHFGRQEALKLIASFMDDNNIPFCAKNW